MTEVVQDLVNRGNDAQREARYGDALALYQEAIDSDPEHPVPQFGALMAALALGESELAESLREKLEVSAPELLAMLNPGGGMGDQAGDPHAGVAGMPPDLSEAEAAGEGGLPPGHPVLMEAVTDTIQPDTTG
jgi:tetratricopeptide (TPR) repeat protein